MNELAERSVNWQQRNITPILLALALIAVMAVTAVGGVPIWLGILIGVFVAWALIQRIRQRRRSTV